MKYIIQFVSCSGSGFIKVDQGHSQSSPWDPNREWGNLDEAKAYADKLQRQADKDGNQWGYTHIVKTAKTYREVYSTRKR